jgi:hypothetical protein
MIDVLVASRFRFRSGIGLWTLDGTAIKRRGGVAVSRSGSF